jgi:hypothetical protein
MLDQSLTREQQAADLAHAPAGAPATATIVADSLSKRAQRIVAGKDDRPETLPPDRPEINPEPAPETNPDLQPEIPPVDTPSILRR